MDTNIGDALILLCQWVKCPHLGLLQERDTWQGSHQSVFTWLSKSAFVKVQVDVPDHSELPTQGRCIWSSKR